MTADSSRLAQALRRAATITDDDLDLMLERTSAWTQPLRQGEGHQWTRGGGTGDTEQSEDRIEDARATRYHSELDTLTRRMLADATRLEELRAIVIPQRPATVGTRDMQAAQLAADGWCISCARDRDDQGRPFLEPVAQGKYADACNWCGRWRAGNNGNQPPIDLVRYRHRSGNKPLTTKVVDAILGRTA